MTNQTVLILGAAGSMGKLMMQLAQNDGWECLGIDVQLQSDVGRALDDALPRAHLVIDFSSPQGTHLLLASLQKFPLPCVIGTTGLDDTHHQKIARIAQYVPVVCATNFSVGMNVLWALVEKTSSLLPPAFFDVEIVEVHHNRKKDAPSGSAWTLAQCVQSGRAKSGFETGETCFHDVTSSARTLNSIGFSVVRGGDVVGEHTVLFLGTGERLELTHRATDRAIFARGAWTAGQLLQGRSPGLYTVRDLLRFESVLK